jgi:D-sedoheptulose 7-phosphate isomerase
MSLDAFAVVRNIFDTSVAAHRQFVQSPNVAAVARAADVIRRALSLGHKVLSFGNGGSAGDAEHLTAELVGRFEIERSGLRAIALTSDSSVVTAIANDYGYEVVFTRQIEALGIEGDVAVGITTSGRSANVVSALAAARAKGLTTIALTGRDGGAAGPLGDVHINVPEASTARVQEVHRTVIHAICALLDVRNS